MSAKTNLTNRYNFLIIYGFQLSSLLNASGNLLAKSNRNQQVKKLSWLIKVGLHFTINFMVIKPQKSIWSWNKQKIKLNKDFY